VKWGDGRLDARAEHLSMKLAGDTAIARLRVPTGED
jgi:hypothetical protein